MKTHLSTLLILDWVYTHYLPLVPNLIMWNHARVDKNADGRITEEEVKEVRVYYEKKKSEVVLSTWDFNIMHLTFWNVI